MLLSQWRAIRRLVSPLSAMRSPPSKASVSRRCANSLPSAPRMAPTRICSILRAGSIRKASIAGSSKISSKLAPSNASIRTGGEASAAADLLLRRASRAAEERVTKQENLFAGVDPGFAARPSLPVVADWPPVERLQHEFDAIGFYLSSHPLDPYAKSLERAGVLRWVDLPVALAANGSTRFRLAGIVIGKKERTSARGNRFAFVQLSDNSGAFEVTVFSEVLAQTRGVLEGGQPLVVTVDVRREEENLRLTVQKIEPLDTIVAQAAAGLRIFVAEAEALPRLKSVISREAGGRGRVTIVLDLPSREIEMALPGGLRLHPKIRAAVKSLPGILDVHDF